MVEVILYKNTSEYADLYPDWDNNYGVYIPEWDIYALNFKKIWKNIQPFGFDEFLGLVCEVAEHEALHSLGMAHDGIYRVGNDFYHWLAKPLKWSSHIAKLQAQERGMTKC